MEQSETVPNLNAEIQVVPKTLKVLGILSLIMGGLMILLTLWSIKKDYLPSEDDIAGKAKIMEDVQRQNPVDGLEKATAFFESQPTSNLISLFTQVISVIGVILMLKLKKNGFYIYIFGELISYFIIAVLFGVSAFYGIAEAYGGIVKTIGMIVPVLMVIQDVIFIVLYAKQLKYMS